MDEEAKSTEGFPILNFTLSSLCSAYGAFAYIKAKNNHVAVRFVSCGALYLVSSALIYSGHSSKGYATGLVPSVVILGATGTKAIFYAGKQAPSIALIASLATFHNGKNLYESLE